MEVGVGGSFWNGPVGSGRRFIHGSKGTGISRVPTYLGTLGKVGYYGKNDPFQEETLQWKELGVTAPVTNDARIKKVSKLTTVKG